MTGKDADWVRVYVDGEYGFVRDGKPVFPEYRDQVHCRPVAAVPGLPIRVGLDFGLTPAAVFGQRAANGQWRLLAELVPADMGTLRFAERLGAELRGRFAGHGIEVAGDPAGDARAQTDERTPFDILRTAGIPARPAPTNDVVIRREAVARALARLIDGEPGLVIDPGCRVLRKVLAGAYRYRRMRVPGREQFQDRPEKNDYSHAADALQYLMVGAGEGRSLIRGPSRAAPAAEEEYDPFRW
ncbi:MAG TPA: hypothetical protein VFO41_17155 [Alphaproteobacteria bacterium]|nr:hypothetical protein [Alphaproteobacteria bacterium]